MCVFLLACINSGNPKYSGNRNSPSPMCSIAKYPAPHFDRPSKAARARARVCPFALRFPRAYINITATSRMTPGKSIEPAPYVIQSAGRSMTTAMTMTVMRTSH